MRLLTNNQINSLLLLLVNLHLYIVSTLTPLSFILLIHLRPYTCIVYNVHSTYSVYFYISTSVGMEEGPDLYLVLTEAVQV